jgi:hypothetical protein
MKITAAGSGIFVYTALDRARTELAAIDTPARHVILLSDARDAEEMCKGMDYPPAETAGSCPAGVPTAVALATAMAKEGVTVTVVGLGGPKDSDVRALNDLARAGGGKFYLTTDARQLAEVFTLETERILGKGPPPPAADAAPPHRRHGTGWRPSP